MYSPTQSSISFLVGLLLRPGLRNWRARSVILNSSSCIENVSIFICRLDPLLGLVRTDHSVGSPQYGSRWVSTFMNRSVWWRSLFFICWAYVFARYLFMASIIWLGDALYSQFRVVLGVGFGWMWEASCMLLLVGRAARMICFGGYVDFWRITLQTTFATHHRQSSSHLIGVTLLQHSPRTNKNHAI